MAVILYILLLLTSHALATVHHLFVGGFGNLALYSLQFDDEKLTLVSSKAASGQSHTWITFDHARKNIYAVAGGKIYSYSALTSTTLRLDNSVEACPGCSGSGNQIFVMAASQAPYSVYSCTWGGTSSYVAMMQVSANGSIASRGQSLEYASGSGVHGLALSPDQRYLYSADDNGNAVWTHEVKADGTLTYVGKLSAPSTGSDPRHAVVHPNGNYLYVVLEKSNQLAIYSIDPQTHLPSANSQVISVIPPGLANANYWADEVVLSPSNKYLWASTRARATGGKGYITAFSLSSSGEVVKQLFLTQTTGSGGSANAITPSFFSDEWMALADSSTGFVEIWQFLNETAKPVARVDIKDGGCCANAIWYD